MSTELIEIGARSLLDEHSEAVRSMHAHLMKVVNKDGEEKVVDNAENLGVVLSMHPDIRNCFAHNLFDGYSYVLAPIPGSFQDVDVNFEARMLDDTDYVAVQRWLQRSIPGLQRTPYQNVVRAVDEACMLGSFDPLRDWVEECAKNWDGQYRIEDLFRTYFVAGEQNAYSDDLGEIVMMGLVLRALQPGAPHRMIPVLQGAQGIGKSQGLAALCLKPEWFTDEVKNLGNKDTQDIIRKMFLVELGEMEVSRKTEREQLKAFLTRTHETFRRAYGRVDKLYPRRCMFWGTSNEDSYLRDTTGNDRFYPIKIARIDVAALKRDRDQLIGEAVHLLRECWEKGENWWELSDDSRGYLEQAREDAEDADPWLPIVAKFVEGLDEVCAGMLMDERGPIRTCGPVGKEGEELKFERRGLGIPIDRRSPADARRVSSILQHKLGWRKDGLMPHDSRHPRTARFVPPAEQEAVE
jgi:predicted P-loop ATPase